MVATSPRAKVASRSKATSDVMRRMAARAMSAASAVTPPSVALPSTSMPRVPSPSSSPLRKVITLSAASSALLLRNSPRTASVTLSATAAHRAVCASPALSA